MRRRRQLILTILILLSTVGIAVGALGTLLKREPDYYANAVNRGTSDSTLAPEVMTRFGDLKNDIRAKPEWGSSFTSEELNAFFREVLGSDTGLVGLLPEGVTDPRVSIEGDRLGMAMRYGSGFWSTVFSVEMRGWLVKEETNTIAIELIGIWAGGLPLGTQSVLDWVSEVGRDANIVVTWYRHNGHPVGIFHFYADQSQPTTQIRRFKIEDGKVIVAGRSLLNHGAPPVVLPPADPPK